MRTQHSITVNIPMLPVPPPGIAIVVGASRITNYKIIHLEVNQRGSAVPVVWFGFAMMMAGLGASMWPRRISALHTQRVRRRWR